jgi:6-phosphogluconolactonase
MFGINVLPDKVDLARASAVHFMEVASCALLDRGCFSVALAGGSTPKATYAMLASAPLDWQHIHIFWGDERCVAPEHMDSNYLVARYAFLDRVDIPSENIHRIHGENPPEQAAADYEQELRAFFSKKSPPVFDLIFLGLGNDGHVASLFPGSPALEERERWVVAVKHRQPPEPLVDRVTITLPVINAARQVTFLVSGGAKAERLQQALTKTKSEGIGLPVHQVQPVSGNLLWLVDEAARGI